MIESIQLKVDSVIVIKLHIGQMPAEKADAFITQTKQQFKAAFGEGQLIMILPIRTGETEITIVHRA